ncbi:MAG TPA: NUDIX domain-containing protein, partial [Micromonosporaceae bacterium]
VIRLAAYGICRREDHLLLARYVSPDRSERHWTLPGGKVEHGEDPYHAVVREFAEETGYQVRVDRLLGVDSRTRVLPSGSLAGSEQHSVGVFYLVRIVGGDLRHELDGSTDLAEWVHEVTVSELERSVIIDVGLALAAGRPPGGHVEPVPVSGLLRH